MIVNIINKKRRNEELTNEELDEAFLGYLHNEVKDYQMSALLMAICINGMTDKEIFHLTKCFVESGDVLDLSDIPGIKVDKHSTGGIGDKTTLIISPIVAALGVPMVKFSGRGLGFTGGTIDKLESIPGFRCDLEEDKILRQVKEIGIVNCSATKNLVPLDKIVYALRDVTGTVESLPLIAISVMSKKIASGADKILIDIKYGKGAFMKNEEEAKALSDIMIRIGNSYDKEVRTILSDMNTPLGYAIGNRLEVQEAISLLQGKESSPHLKELCVELASNMVSMAKDISVKDAEQEVLEVINNGKAYDKFKQLVAYQGGSLDKLTVKAKEKEIICPKDGKIKEIDALAFGELSVELGAGREEKEDDINPNVGIYLNCKLGDDVKKGCVLGKIYYDKEEPNIDVEKFFNIG